MRYQFLSVRMAIIKNLQTLNAGEGVKKREALNFIGDKVYWYNHYGKQYQFSSVALFCLTI